MALLTPENWNIDNGNAFRGRIVSYALSSKESGAVSVFITVRIDEAWNREEKTWDDWREHQMEVSGDLWIVKKDGSMNEGQIRTLCEAGWDGDLLSIVGCRWQPVPIQITINTNEYKGNVSYRIAWIKEYDIQPGGGNVSPDQAKALQDRFGPQLRALRGNTQRNAASPSTSGPTKPVPNPAAKPTEGDPKAAFAPLPAEMPDDKIPF